MFAAWVVWKKAVVSGLRTAMETASQWSDTHLHRVHRHMFSLNGQTHILTQWPDTCSYTVYRHTYSLRW